MSWWRDGVLYQIYPRSVADSGRDGIGDLRGLIGRLDHLQWLGVDGIWLNPTFPSPNADWGYDVADYRDVHPDLGTLADVDDLIREAGARDMRVLLDLVPNHTSDRHAWFADSRGARDSPRREYYVWRDPRPDGSPPNNWVSNFGGSAWTLDDATGQFYLHNFLPEQPDLNWWSDAVRDEFDDILRFWFERGIAGFRIDVAHGIVKDRDLRDDPETTAADHPIIQRRGLRQEFSMNRPEVHDVFRRWRTIAAGFDPERVLVGETYVLDPAELIPFYGSDSDELHLAFNFPFVHSELEAPVLRGIVEQVERLLPEAAWPVWTGSNHDAGRLATRWAGGDPARTRSALLMLLTLRGTPFLYYGDELGLPEVELDDAQRRDRRTGGALGERDGCRTPMPWTAEPGAGFTAADVDPWLPIGDASACNVADQRADPGSTLHFVRDLIALRRDAADLTRGDYATLPAPEQAWAWRRGAGHAVAINLGSDPVAVQGLAGSIAIATDRARDGEPVRSSLELPGWSGAVVRLRA